MVFKGLGAKERGLGVWARQFRFGGVMLRVKDSKFRSEGLASKVLD